MPERSTLGLVADIVIQRAIAEAGSGPALYEALAAAYPFADDPTAYGVWIDALRRHDIPVDVPPPPSATCMDAGEPKGE